MLILILFSILAGLIGALSGLGGGIIVTPVLVMLFHLDIHYAIATSLLCVIATSSGAGISYLKKNIVNEKIGVFLSLATAIGAIVGAIISSYLNPQILYIFFGVLLLYTALKMLSKKHKNRRHISEKTGKLANYFNLDGRYFDEYENEEIYYGSTHVGKGFSIMLGAGAISGLLGIGGGAFKVVAMELTMRMPLRVSTATSNFMMGITASASVFVYFFKGNIQPVYSTPVIIGVLIGAMLGGKLSTRIASSTMRKIVVPLIIIMGSQMLIKGVMLWTAHI